MTVLQMITAYLQRIFAIYPPGGWQAAKIYLAFTLIASLFAIVLIFLKTKKQNFQKIQANLQNFFLFWSVSGLILWFVRVQRIPFFGMDFWRILQEILLISWGFYLIWSFFRPDKSQEIAHRQEEIEAYKARFLPKSKKSAKLK